MIVSETIVVPYPGAAPITVRERDGDDRITCWLCGRDWPDDYMVQGRSACGPCYAAWPYNTHPDWAPPGMELGGTGI